MIAIRFLIILLVMLGLYYVFIYRNISPVTTHDPVFSTSMLYEGLGVYPYIAFLPAHHGTKEKTFPLILFLHDESNSIDQSKEYALNQSSIPYAASQTNFPFIVTAPLTTKEGWDMEKLLWFLDGVEMKMAVNPKQVFLTGVGDGANAVWMLGVFYPERFSAIAPAAGTGDPKSARESLADIPIWIFHGKQDQTFPVEHSLLMVGALQDQNKNLNFTIYQDKGHDIWREVYHNPKLYDWFLQLCLKE